MKYFCFLMLFASQSLEAKSRVQSNEELSLQRIGDYGHYSETIHDDPTSKRISMEIYGIVSQEQSRKTE